MTEEDKKKTSGLLSHPDVLERVAGEAETTVEEVRQMLQRFESLEKYQVWLKERKVRGQQYAVPRTRPAGTRLT